MPKPPKKKGWWGRTRAANKKAKEAEKERKAKWDATHQNEYNKLRATEKPHSKNKVLRHLGEKRDWKRASQITKKRLGERDAPDGPKSLLGGGPMRKARRGF